MATIHPLYTGPTLIVSNADSLDANVLALADGTFDHMRGSHPLPGEIVDADPSEVA